MKLTHEQVDQAILILEECLKTTESEYRRNGLCAAIGTLQQWKTNNIHEEKKHA